LRDGESVKIYGGPLNSDLVREDLRSIPKTVGERMPRALPFSAESTRYLFDRNNLSLAIIQLNKMSPVV
jgi:hypothetical protein